MKTETKFNPQNKDQLSYRECLGPAMEITDPGDAKQYLADYVAFIQKTLDSEPRSDGRTAASIAAENLGYYAGYYSHETRERVEELFRCAHPVFGKASVKTPTAQEAFEAGRKLAIH